MLGSKFVALETVLTCPMWPYRADLPDAALPLYDAITHDAKAVALTAAEADYGTSSAMAARWVPLLDDLLNSVKVVGNEPCERLCRVFTHYVRAAHGGVDLAKL